MRANRHIDVPTARGLRPANVILFTCAGIQGSRRPWKIVGTRGGDEAAPQTVKGWRASGRRIAEIGDGVRACGQNPASR